jgi:hypothetical protein
MSTGTGMYFSLSPGGPVRWNHNQESSLFQDISPFSPVHDGRSTTTLGERLRELYLQTLWLPEVRIRVLIGLRQTPQLRCDQSIMPLNRLVQMVQLLARHDARPSTSPGDVHPLHAALDDILLTGNWCSYKYQEQLPNAMPSASRTDLETSIMLFVLERHALCGEQQSREPGHCSLDDKKRWLSGIEKRE